MAFAIHRQAPGLQSDAAAQGLLRAIDAAVAVRAAAIGSRPAALRVILDALSLGTPLPAWPTDARRATPLQRALVELRTNLYIVPSRAAESLRLWREAAATAWLAAAIARLAGGSPGTAGCAGLLHRAGEGLALQALAGSDEPLLAALDIGSLRQCCSDHEAALSAALARSWRLPHGVSLALTGWRRAPEVAVTADEARAVYYANALANQAVLAEFPAPGLAEQLRADLRLDRRELDSLERLAAALRVAVGGVTQ
jgi:hypothetical protein